MRRTPTSTTPSPRPGSLRLPILLALLTACGAPAPSPEDAERDINAMLDASAEAWNRGDLDGFIDDYAPDATFVGSTGLIRGRHELRQRYVDGYWSQGTPDDGLRFELLEVRMEAPTAALAVGRYILYDRESEEATATGLFSLTLRWTADGWKIAHDHSSADED